MAFYNASINKTPDSTQDIADVRILTNNIPTEVDEHELKNGPGVLKEVLATCAIGIDNARINLTLKKNVMAMPSLTGGGCGSSYALSFAEATEQREGFGETSARLVTVASSGNRL